GVLAVGVTALACAGPASAADVLAVKAAHIITMVGPPLDGGTVLIRDGKVVRIGRDFAIPEGAALIEVEGGTVMPGLIDANAMFAFRGEPNEESEEITPDFEVLQAIDRDSPDLKRAVQLGITTLRVAPGNANVIAGSGAVIKSCGPSLESVLVKEGGQLKVVMGNDSTGGNATPRSGRPTSFYYRQPTTRMGVVWLLRQALFRVKTALGKGEALTPSDTAIAEALKGKLPVEISLRSAVDVETAFEVMDEFGLRRLVLVGCPEGYKLSREIARRGVPVILGPLYAYPRTWREASEAPDVSLNSAGLLAQAGVKVALGSGDGGGPVDLLAWVVLTHRYGLPREAALAAVTTNAADILGVADRVGSLAPGKDADLVILTGDPLQATSRVDKVIVNGRVAYDAQSGASAHGEG
ncbi:MAG: amidohydrolase family protein, partial [Armatimonadetes bacterium]|nr:amidohydrolase family protein [Armatimonadota bacterium]